MTSPRPQQSDEPIKILHVEDNPGDARLVQEAFRGTDCETTIDISSTAENAIDVLSEEAGTGALPDLVLLDLNLPGQDGCAMLKTIRVDPAIQCLPVMMLTSSNDEGDVARCYDAHTNAYLTKPSSPDGFVSLAEAIEEFWFKEVHLPPIRT